MDIINAYLRGTLEQGESMFGGTIQAIRPRIKCNDDFEISVQASRVHYCTPRVDGDVIYETIELGYPSVEDSLIVKYAEDPEDLCNTVYGYVPVDVVNQLIKKHRGIVDEQMKELA